MRGMQGQPAGLAAIPVPSALAACHPGTLGNATRPDQQTMRQSPARHAWRVTIAIQQQRRQEVIKEEVK